MANSILKDIRDSVKHWYLPVIIGIILLLTGIWTFRSPAESYLALAMIFSISFIFSGLLEIFFAISNRDTLRNWGWTLVFGIATLVVGLILVRNPLISLATLPFYVGFMILFRSVGAIGYSMDLKEHGELEWGTFMVLGVLGIIFSSIMLWNPVFGGLNIVIWTGIIFVTSGIFNIYLGFRMKRINKNVN